MGVIQPPNDNTLMAEINITPFTDVLLVLLIIFMVSATFLTQSAFNIKLPETVSKTAAGLQGLIVTIKADSIIIGDTEVSQDILAIKLEQEAKAKPGQKVIIMADSKIPYGTVINVMDKLKQAGFSSISLATRKVQSTLHTP